MIKLKTFEELYPDFDTFKANVLTPIDSLMGNPIPVWLDDSKLYFKMNALYVFMFNKYSEFAAVNTDDKQHMLMQNALTQLLPVLYTKTLQITNEALGNLSISELLKNIERRYNEDADNKYASTETAYSSTPDDSQSSGTFGVDNVREKNVILRKDGTVRVRELSNLIDKFNAIGDLQTSGFIVDFLNSIELSSLWEYWEEDAPYAVQGLKGDKGDTGATGATGPKGEQGNVGPQGPQGIQGVKGDQGDKGDTGDNGKDGIDGTDGTNGTNGTDGADGNSFKYLGTVPTVADLPANANDDDAYEVLADDKLYIYNGTAWVATGTIQGPAGPTGPAGPKGDQGDKGDTGTTGAAGAKGDKGDQGDQGPTGATGPQGAKGDAGKDGKDGISPTWNEVTDFWSNPDMFKKYKDKQIRFTTQNGIFEKVGFNQFYSTIYIGGTVNLLDLKMFSMKVTTQNENMLESTKTPTDFFPIEKWPITKVEVK